jgi:hypothetical protein
MGLGYILGTGHPAPFILCHERLVPFVLAFIKRQLYQYPKLEANSGLDNHYVHIHRFIFSRIFYIKYLEEVANLKN